jgi:hypothetical protein
MVSTVTSDATKRLAKEKVGTEEVLQKSYSVYTTGSVIPQVVRLGILDFGEAERLAQKTGKSAVVVEAEAWERVYRLLAKAINDISTEKADEEGWAKNTSETVDEKLVDLLALYQRCCDVRQKEADRRARNSPLMFKVKVGPGGELSLDGVVKAIREAKENGDG